MARILRNLRIDEVASVDKGAGEGVKIVLLKRHDDTPHHETLLHRRLKKIFDKLLEENDPVDDDNQIDPNDPPTALHPKLQQAVNALVKMVPGLDEAHGLFWLLNSPHGKRFAEHHASITKKEKPMPQVDIFKLHNVASVVEVAKSAKLSEHDMSAVVMGHAKLAKRDNETVHQAYARIVDGNIDIRRALLKSDVPNLMDITPMSVETGSTLVADDSMKAYRQLQELAAQQHKTFEEVFADPANGALARGTYTSAHRPNVSSPSYHAGER